MAGVSGHTCDGGALEDAIEEVAAGASGLQNLGDGDYQLNWKSPKTYVGTCRILQLDLGEGQMRRRISVQGMIPNSGPRDSKSRIPRTT